MLRVLRVTVVALALGVSACGGGSDDSSSPGGDDGSTTTEAESTTSTIPSSPAAEAASLTAADMGGDWREYPDEPVGEVAGGSTCGDPTVADTVEATTDGELLQRGELDRYVQTSTWEFATPTDAKAFAEERLGDEWIECVRSTTEDGLAEDPPQTVKSYGVSREPQGDFIGQYGLEFDEEVDGKQAYTGAYAVHSVYQKGTIVIDQFYQAITRDSDAKTLDGDIETELNAGIDKVLARVPS